MLIGLDAHMVGTRETGNETYVKGLVAGFGQRAGGTRLIAYQRGRAWQPDSSTVTLRRLRLPGNLARLGLELPVRAAADRVDIVHTTYAAPAWSPRPVVVTVHDVTFALHPEWFSARDRAVLRAGVGWSARTAARLVTPSQASAADIAALYPGAAGRIRVVPDGVELPGPLMSPDEAAVELRSRRLDPARPYLLAVGTLRPRKNLHRLVRVFVALVDAGRLDCDLVLAGPGPGAALAGHPRVRLTGYLDDRQLRACYTLAHAVVHPALHEGFGHPPLEAMALGIPVAASNGGALPEVCGDAAEYFDPTDEDSMATAVERVAGDRELRAGLVERGRARAAGLTWARAAERLEAIYAEAAT